MANRNYASGGKLYSMHVKPVMIDVKIRIGTAGAVASISGAMVQSVVRVSTGTYKIKMQPQTNFTRVFSTEGNMHSPAMGLSGISAIEFQSSPSTSMAITTGGELTVKTLNASGALADPAFGSTVNVMVIASDSGVLLPGE